MVEPKKKGHVNFDEELDKIFGSGKGYSSKGNTTYDKKEKLKAREPQLRKNIDDYLDLPDVPDRNYGPGPSKEVQKARKNLKKTKKNIYVTILFLIGTYLMSTYIPKDGITGNYILNSGTSLFTLLFMIVVLIVALILIKNTFFKKEVVKPIRKKSRTKRKAKSKRRK